MATIGYSDPVREILGLDKAEFYLTGSRFFSCAEKLSDYDFFTANDEETKVRLLAKGFEYIGDSGYDDLETVDILRYRNSNGIQIDVQFVKDIHLKQKAQELIRMMGVYSRSNADMCRVWNNAFRYINEKVIKANA